MAFTTAIVPVRASVSVDARSAICGKPVVRAARKAQPAFEVKAEAKPVTFCAAAAATTLLASLPVQAADLTPVFAAVEVGPSTTNIAIMIAANAFAAVVGRYGIEKRGVGPRFPIELPEFMKDFTMAELLAVMCFGHILGVGVILGLSA
eukprot:tig00021127_g18800.t1